MSIAGARPDSLPTRVRQKTGLKGNQSSVSLWFPFSLVAAIGRAMCCTYQKLHL